MTASSSPSLRIGAGAHRGKVREENQDRISRFRSAFGEVFVVADGVGGYQGGAQAAEMVIAGLEAHLRELPPDTLPAEALRQAARRTSADVHRSAQSGDPALADMGSTGVVALLAGRHAWIGHAGDCRAYLWRSGELSRLTRDHTRVQQMVERNLLSEDEARNHPDASIVTRAFGKQPDLELEVSPPVELRDGDTLLLASDGLCGYVEDTAIAGALRGSGDPQEVADRLIGLALEAGGEDNVSVQVIARHGGAAERATPAALAAAAPWYRQRPLLWAAVGALLLVAFLAGLFIPWRRWYESGLAWWKGGEPPRQETPTQKQRSENKDPREPVAGGSVEVRVSILGGPTGGTLHELIAPFVPQVVPGEGEEPDGFRRGHVYFRRGRREAAVEILQKLNQTAEKGRAYTLKKWPQKRVKTWRDVDVLVVAWGTDEGREEP